MLARRPEAKALFAPWSLAVYRERPAAAHAGCESLSTFHDWVRRNILPGPIPGTHIWDKKAIDASLDRASGFSTTEMSALEQWKKNRERERVRQAKTPVPLDQDPRKR